MVHGGFSVVGEEVCLTILYALLPMASNVLSSSNIGLGFSELMGIMATLAGAGQGGGHLHLFKAAIQWMATW